MQIASSLPLGQRIAAVLHAREEPVSMPAIGRPDAAGTARASTLRHWSTVRSTDRAGRWGQFSR